MNRRVTLNRALSKLGLGSRSQAEFWIREGLVLVDGKTVSDPLAWIDLDAQEVRLCGEEPKAQTPIALVMNKPKGVVTTMRDELGRKTVFDLLPRDLGYLFPAGRLDADSEGLLLFSNDSSLTALLTEPDRGVGKTYRATVRGTLSSEQIQRLRDGVVIDGKLTLPCKVKDAGATGNNQNLDIVLMEGKNRQIRKMIREVGSKALRLVRTKIGPVQLGDLAPGKTRLLSAGEIASLRAAAK